MRIGEVARRSGVSARMLRHYESLGLVEPSVRTSAGYREYAAADITRIFHIESLRSLGLSLSQVAKALEDPEFSPETVVDELITRTEVRIAREQELLARLEEISDADPTDWQRVLKVLSVIGELESASPPRRQQAVLTAGDGTVPAASLVRAVLSESEPNVAGALRWALARTGDEAVAPLAEALRDPDPEVRRRAAAALADLDVPESTTALSPALDDDDAAVRSIAALALAPRGDERTIEPLVSAVVAGDGDVEAGEALGALAEKLGTGDEIAARLTRELDRASAEVRTRVAQALGEVPGEKADRALATLASDTDEATARTAMYLIQRRGD